MLKTLLNADEEEMYREMRESENAIRFMMAHPKLDTFFGIFRTAFWWMRYMYCLKIARHGHDICDTSCGGPDSGDISGYCKRCGWSYHTQLY